MKVNPGEKIRSLGMQASKSKGVLQKLLPANIPVDRMLRVFLMAVSRSPKLLECSERSLLSALMVAARLGLEPDGGVLGQGYLVPRWNKNTNCLEATFQAGYMGLMDLARKSKQIKDLAAQAVYNGDQFFWSYGLERDTLQHVPCGETSPDKLTHAWARARLVNGGLHLVVITREQVERARARSMTPNTGPWVTDYGPMACKSALRLLWKLLPRSTELVIAAEVEKHPEHAEAIALDDPTAALDVIPEVIDPLDAMVDVERPPPSE